MAKKQRSPLEWSGYGRLIAATDAAPVNGSVNLALRDDEVAEIHKIIYRFENILAATTTGARADMLISMDPDTVEAPLVVASQEDLEVIHIDSFVHNVLQLVADVDELYLGTKMEQLDFKEPVLVGTNVGISSQFTWLTADGSGSLWVKIYFQRRSATVTELNRILLKRR